MDRAQKTRTRRRKLSALLASLALMGSPLAAQGGLETLTPHHPGMGVVACGGATAPAVTLSWGAAPGVSSLRTLSQPETSLTLTNTLDRPVTVAVELTLDRAGRTVQEALKAMRLEAQATETLAVPLSLAEAGLEGLGSIEAHARITSDTGADLGQTASPVLYFEGSPEGALESFGEAVLLQRQRDAHLENLSTRGLALPPGVTLEMSSVAVAEPASQTVLDGPGEDELLRLEQELAAEPKTPNQEIER